MIRSCLNPGLESLHLFAGSETTKGDVATLSEYRHHNISFTPQPFLTQHITQIKLHHASLTFSPSSLNQFHLPIHAHIPIHQLSVALLLSLTPSLTNFQEHLMIAVTSWLASLLNNCAFSSTESLGMFEVPSMRMIRQSDLFAHGFCRFRLGYGVESKAVFNMLLVTYLELHYCRLYWI